MRKTSASTIGAMVINAGVGQNNAGRGGGNGFNHRSMQPSAFPEGPRNSSRQAGGGQQQAPGGNAGRGGAQNNAAAVVAALRTTPDAADRSGRRPDAPAR